MRLTAPSNSQTKGGGMTRLICDITTSLDGYVAGPNQTLEEPLGRGGELLHDWLTATRAWRSSPPRPSGSSSVWRSEKHTSELQSTDQIVCRLLPVKKN